MAIASSKVFVPRGKRLGSRMTNPPREHRIARTSTAALNGKFPHGKDTITRGATCRTDAADVRRYTSGLVRHAHWNKPLHPIAILAVAVVVSGAISAAEADLKWFRFDKTFIQAKYPTDVAFGRLTIEDLYAASALHDVGCSGDDGEIHVGVYDADIAVPGNQRPISRPVRSPPGGWGVVIEPPNATSKDASFLNAFEKTSPRPRQTWDGYWRVWNESHWHGHPTKNPKGFSNPNHVLELHPAWRMTLDDGTERSYSVARIEGFRGYGLNKFDTDDYEFHALNPAEWLKVYQTSASLYVQLVHTANFFSLPVIVRDRDVVAGVAQILDLDVCADASATPALSE
jgi:hypothetical protein